MSKMTLVDTVMVSYFRFLKANGIVYLSEWRMQVRCMYRVICGILDLLGAEYKGENLNYVHYIVIYVNIQYD